MEQTAAREPEWVGSYRLLRRLGSGGMGHVHLARSEGGRTVAVKQIKAELAAEPEFRSRFRLEVEAARRVGARWTAPVLDADTEAGTPWVATGYIAGLPLQQAVSGSSENAGPLPEPSVHVLAHGLGGALVDIHAAGLIHRDLKPSNVLITIDGPRVIDFGIARSLSGLGVADTTMTSTGAVMGSPSFMSPEQIRGLRLTPASDVFCMGEVLAYAATGHAPFGSSGTIGAHAVMFRAVEEEPDLQDIGEPLRSLIAGCLAKDPEQRPAPQDVVDATTPPTRDPAPAPWLPAGLIAELGRHAVELLDTDTPPSGCSGSRRPPPAETPVPQGSPAPPGITASPDTPAPPAPSAAEEESPAAGTPSDGTSSPSGGTTVLPAAPRDETPQPSRSSRRPRWLPALAAAFVLVAAGTGLAVSVAGTSDSDDGEPATALRSDVPDSYTGTWSGPVERDGEPTGQYRRFVITRGTVGEVVANSMSLGATYACKSDGRLVSAGDFVELDTEVVKSIPPKRCSALGSHRLTAEPDGTLTWEAAGRTASLHRVDGDEELPARYRGTWVRTLANGGTQRMTIDDVRAGRGSGIRLVSTGGGEHCEATAGIFSAGGDAPVRITPPSVDTEASSGTCDTGHSSVLRARDGGLVREFPDSGTPLTYTRAGG